MFSNNNLFNSFAVSTTNPQVQSGATRLFAFWSMAVSYFAMLIMISPLLLKDITGADAAAEWQGTLTSTTAFMGLILCSILGYLSDHFGRLVFIRLWSLCYVGASLGMIFCEVTGSLNGLLFARLVPFSVASALTYAFASDIATDSSEVLKAHSSLGATFSVSLLIGNVMTAGLGMMFSRLVVLISGMFLALGACYLAFFSLGQIVLHQEQNNNSININNINKNKENTKVDVAVEKGEEDDCDSRLSPEPIFMSPSILSGDSSFNEGAFSKKTNHLKKNSTSATEHRSWLEALCILGKDPLAFNLVFAYSIFRCANVNSFAVFVLFVDRKFGWSIQDIAFFLCLIGLIGAVVQALVVRWMNDYLNHLPPLEGGAKLLKFFFALLLSTPFISIGYGAAPSGAFMYAIALPAGVVTVLTAIFTSKIASLTKPDGLTGFSLGLVGSLQNLIESVLGMVWGKLLSYSIVNFDPSSFAFGLPYYVNAGVYAIVFLLVLYAHNVHGSNRSLWLENEAAATTPLVQEPSQHSRTNSSSQGVLMMMNDNDNDDGSSKRE